MPEPSAQRGREPTQWVPADRLAGQPVLGRHVEALSAASGNLSAAVMAFAQGLAYALVGPAAAGAVVAGVVPAARPDDLLLGFAPGGICTRVAAKAPRVVAARPGRFEQRVADTAVHVLEPVIEELHRCSRLGRRVLWSVVPDAVAAITMSASLAAADVSMPTGTGTAAGPAADTVGDAGTVQRLQRAWSSAQPLIDACVGRIGGGCARPRRVAVDGDLVWMVRGGCCFVYRIAGAGRFCATCPVLDERTRAVHLAAWLRGARNGS